MAHQNGLPTIEIIGVPFDLGASRRGAALGPQAVRAAGLQRSREALKYDVRDLGDIKVKRTASGTAAGPGQPRNLSQVLDACLAPPHPVERPLQSNAFPCV